MALIAPITDVETLRVLLQNEDIQYRAALNQTYMYGGATVAALLAGKFFNKWVAYAAIPLAYLTYKEWKAAGVIRDARDKTNVAIMMNGM